MPSPISLPDLLGALPDDARARILGGSFTRAYAGCRLLILCTIADFFPRLRRLVLPLPGNTALGGLAACAQLRELTTSLLKLTPAALEGLAKLQQLERLTLGNFSLHAGDERLLTQLLTTHRPPNLLYLKLGGLFGSLLEVDFERAGSQPGGRSGMRCVTLNCGTFTAGGMYGADQLARAVLATADQLQQLTVPELAVESLELGEAWRPPEYLRPGDSLPRLVARCGRVELGSLHAREYCIGLPRWAPGWDPAPVLAVVRLMGLPRGLDLLHGWCLPQARSQELASHGAAVGAAEPAGEPAGGPAAAPAPFEPRQTRQMTRLQRQREQQLGMRSQQLQLDTATPEQVLLRAVDELAAEAVQAGANGGGGGGGGGGSGAAGGRLLMLRGALPPRGAGSTDSEAWMKGAVEHCVRLAVQERARQQPERSQGAGGALRTAGPPSSAGVLERCWELIDATAHHVAAPAAGVLLLDCGTDQRAAELAALLVGTAGASSVERRGEAGSARAVTAVVLTDMWARSEQGGGSGTSSNAGGGTGGGSNHKVADEDALRQLLVLDDGVRQLWQLVWLQHHIRPESDSDPGTDADDDDDDDEDDDLVW
ncbi:hypothetical protein HXX76_012119 [Chlamydomonas incerta]|uniref:Uncharacterized protein n=1 Tax=Chlamydomonas incerta TaxID=51695 RepID=A0A835SIU1_CHLIN|nr:hypothetical protein HXX76_012119 [Chlamydomonas incerta]|eukprot:KAG2427794.1 hypothetical protein HXX76_012119 [Chlamydomonas incerta]